MELKDQKLDLTQYSEEQFVERFGGLYEYSAWVAEVVWSRVSRDQSINFDALSVQLSNIVETAMDNQKMALLRTHPELAGKAAVQRVQTENRLMSSHAQDWINVPLRCLRSSRNLIQSTPNILAFPSLWPCVTAVAKRFSSHSRAACKTQ